jgi:competence protein ComEC
MSLSLTRRMVCARSGCSETLTATHHDADVKGARASGSASALYSAIMRPPTDKASHEGAWLAFTLIAFLMSAFSTAQGVKPLSVYWIDVEGGAATLVVTPAGESILVDAGNPGGRDPGRIAKTAKEAAHLSRIDFVVVTHLHNDHFGGVAELSALIPLGALFENGIDNAPPTERAQATVAAFRSASVARRIVVTPGQEFPLKQTSGAPPTKLKVLGARQTFAPGGSHSNSANCGSAVTKPVDESDNANSVIMVLEQGPFRMFLGGDTTWNVEGKLVCPDDRVGTVEVFQSVHHGLDLSNNPVLVHTLQPHVVVFNNGARKGLEQNAVATVNGTSSVEAVYQVHRGVRDGAVNTAADRIANRDEACAGDGIAMTVAPDGKSYELSVPSTGHKHTYRTRTP